MTAAKKFFTYVAAHPQALFVFVSVVVILSRLPFITESYGMDGDGWRVVNVARTMAADHRYMASRFPGYPFFELTLALLGPPAAWITNLLTALLSGAAAGFFALLVRRFSQSAMAAGFAFAFTPVIYINSFVTMDYLWALCFLTISLYLFFVSRSYLLSGIFIGLAAGCRITSLLMCAPLCIILLRSINWRDLFRFNAGAVFVTGALFTPVIATYGFSFFSFADAPFSTLPILKKMTVDVWGFAGCVGLFVLFFIWLRSRSTKAIPDVGILTAVSVGLFMLFFLRLPVDAGYLAPIVPMTILFLSTTLEKKQMRWLAVVMIVSSSTFSIAPADRSWHPSPSPLSYRFFSGSRTVVLDPLYGPVVKEYQKIRQQERFLDGIDSFIHQHPEKTALLIGDFISKTATRRGLTLAEHFREDYYIAGDNVIAAFADSIQLSGLQSEGFRIFHLADVSKTNRQRYGVSPEQFGSQEVIVQPE